MTGEPRIDQGLCGRCVHRRLLRSRRSVFVRCGLADSDPRFPRYPVLPVGSCAGFRAAVAPTTAQPEDAEARGEAVPPPRGVEPD